MFPTTLPLFAKDLGASDSILGWVTGIATVAALLVRPVSGAILDRFGRKGIFIIGILIMIGVSFSFAFFPVVGIILAIRFVHGIGWGIASTAASTIASDVIPKKRFGEGIGYFGLSASLALAFAPGISVTLFHSIGMQNISFIAAAILVVTLLLSLVIRYKPVERSKPGENVKIALFEKKSILPSAVIFFVTATYGAIVTFSALLAQERGITEGFGIFFTVYALALLVSRPAFGKLTDMKGPAFAVVPGLIFLLTALVLLSSSDSLIMFAVSAVLYGIGFGALQSSLQAMAITSAPQERRGAANATFYTGFDAGIGLGSILAGIIATAVGYANMFLVITLFPLLGAIFFAVVALRNRRRHPPQ